MEDLDFGRLLINLKWMDTGMDHRALIRKLIVCQVGASVRSPW